MADLTDRIARPPQFPPAAAGRVAARLLNRHSAHEIAEAVEILVDVLDLIGGDPDAEDATDAEDDFALSTQAIRGSTRIPGCPAADAEDTSWTEWHTRGRQKDDPGVVGKFGWQLTEDDEDDDPAEDGDDDAEHDDGREPEDGI